MNSILVDPTFGLSEYSLHYSSVEELKAKAFGRERKNESSIVKITEPKYCSKVLHGNWFEERAQYCAMPVSVSLESSTQNVITPPIKIDIEENFRIAKIIRDRARGITRDLLVDYNSMNYQNNFSTVYDLTYRFLPQKNNGQQLRSYNSRTNKWIPEQDLTKNFGNMKGYGLKEYIKELQQEFIYEENEKPQTHYQCDFTEKKISENDKRFHRKRVNLDIPDLRHLNIDLNTCWSRYLGQEFQRKDMCQRISCGRY